MFRPCSAGDLARIIDTNQAENQCTVKLVPRFDYAHLQAKEEGTAGAEHSSTSHLNLSRFCWSLEPPKHPTYPTKSAHVKPKRGGV